eukprot:gene13868-15316_t
MDLLPYDKDHFHSCNIILSPEDLKTVLRNIRVLGALSIITSSLSIIGTASVIIFIIYKRICRSPDVNPLFHLSIADFLLALFWVIGPIIHFKYAGNQFVVDLSYFCSTWQGLCEMVHIMSFFLTVNYALNVFLRMKEKKDRMFQLNDPLASQQHIINHSWFRVGIYAFSWVMPIAIIIPLLIEMRRSQPDFCQQCIILLDAPRPFSFEGNLLGYNGPMLIILSLTFSIVAIIVLYLLTLRMYRKTILGFHTNRQRVVVHAMAKRAAVYIAVFIYCWTPALILASIKLHGSYQPNNGDNPMIKYFPLYVVQVGHTQFVVATASMKRQSHYAIVLSDCSFSSTLPRKIVSLDKRPTCRIVNVKSNFQTLTVEEFLFEATLTAPLQGFLNSLVYGWSRKSFRDAVERESRRILIASHPEDYGAAWESPSSSLTASGQPEERTE